jgi:hypothetical protein
VNVGIKSPCNGANWHKLAQHVGANRVAFGAGQMAPTLFHLATHAERILIRRHNEPLRANHIIIGANCRKRPLAQWTPSITHSTAPMHCRIMFRSIFYQFNENSRWPP